MRILLGVGMVLALCITSAADEKKDEKIDGAKLIGKWEPVMPKKGELVSLEFTKDGKMIATADINGKSAKAEGTYKLTGDKLMFEVTYMGETAKETVTITKLTDDELVGKNQEGKVESFKRAKPKN